MNLRKFLFMALLLLAGAVALWRSGMHLPARGIGEKSPVLSGVRMSETERIAASSPVTPYSLEKEGDHWQLRAPGEGPADSKKVEQLLTTLGSLNVQSEIGAGEGESDPSAYGLTPPELIVTIEGSYGMRTLNFGKKAVSGRRYLRIDGDERVYLIDDHFFTALNVEADSLRDRLAIKFDPAAVSELTVIRGENDFLKFKRGERWTVESPAGEIPADAEFISTKLEDLRKVKVKRFIDEPGEDLSAFGLNPPKALIRIHTGADEDDTENDVTVQAGEGEPEDADASLAVKAYYFKVAGQPFVCEAGRPFYNDFLQGPDYFRPRNPLEFLRGKHVERIEMELGGESAVAVNGPKGWMMGEGENALPPKPGLVDELLNEAAALRVLTYPGTEEGKKAETGLPKPAARFKIFLKDRTAPVMLELGAPVRTNGANPDGETPYWAAMSQEDGTFFPAIVRSSKLFSDVKPGRNQIGKKP